MVSLCLLPGHLFCATGRQTGHQTGATHVPAAPGSPLTAGCAQEAWAAAHGDNMQQDPPQGLGPTAHTHQTVLAERLRAGLETC